MRQAVPLCHACCANRRCRSQTGQGRSHGIQDIDIARALQYVMRACGMGLDRGRKSGLHSVSSRCETQRERPHRPHYAQSNSAQQQQPSSPKHGSCASPGSELGDALNLWLAPKLAWLHCCLLLPSSWPIVPFSKAARRTRRRIVTGACTQRAWIGLQGNEPSLR